MPRDGTFTFIKGIIMEISKEQLRKKIAEDIKKFKESGKQISEWKDTPASAKKKVQSCYTK